MKCGKIIILCALTLATIASGQGGYNPDTLNPPTTAWSLNWLLHPNDGTALTDLGHTAWSQVWITHPDDATALTDLGLSTYFQGLIAHADANELRPDLHLPYEINVRDDPYLAAGDGVTDDTAAFTAALADCAPGGTVLVPAGDYRLTTLTLGAGDDYKTLSGVGWDSRLVFAAAAESIHIPTGAQNVRLRDLEIDGNDIATQLYAAGSYLIIERCHIYGHTTRQVHLRANMGTLRDCKIHSEVAAGCDQVILAEYNDWTIDHCQLNGQTDCNIVDVNAVETVLMQKGRIINSQLESWPVSGAGIGLRDNAESLDIVGNYFESTGGIAIYAGPHLYKALNIQRNWVGTASDAVVLNRLSYAGQVTITHNTFFQHVDITNGATTDPNHWSRLPRLNIHDNAFQSNRSAMVELNNKYYCNEIRSTMRTNTTWGVASVQFVGFERETTDATETTLFEIYVPDTGGAISAQAIRVHAEFLACDDWTMGNTAEWYESDAVVRNPASCTIIAEDDTGLGDGSAAGWACSWDVTGDLTRLRITGQAGITVLWQGDIEIAWKGI